MTTGAPAQRESDGWAKADLANYGYDRLAWARKAIAEQGGALAITEAAKIVLSRLDQLLAASTLPPSEPNEAEVERAIRAGCWATDMHLACSFPKCSCKKIPDAIRAGLAAAVPSATLVSRVEQSTAVAYQNDAPAQHNDAEPQAEASDLELARSLRKSLAGYIRLGLNADIIEVLDNQITEALTSVRRNAWDAQHEADVRALRNKAVECVAEGTLEDAAVFGDCADFLAANKPSSV